MNADFLKLYNQELHFIREMGASFAKEYPKIAAKLDIDENNLQECPDPYVERLLEGFAFLSAGIKHKLNARFPVLNQHLLELTYPQFLAPIPSMLIAELVPDYTDPSLMQGTLIPKNSVMSSTSTSSQGTKLRYTTAHSMKLWPFEIKHIDVAYTASELTKFTAAEPPQGSSAGLRIRLSMANGQAFEELECLDEVTFYINGDNDVSKTLYEQLFSHASGILIRPVGGSSPWQETLSVNSIKHRGFDADDALLPVSGRNFSGFRILQEYFTLPERIRFFQLTELGSVFKKHTGTEIDIIILFANTISNIHSLDRLNKHSIKLNCTPAINLFPCNADPISIKENQDEYQVVVERTRHRDYEVHSIVSMLGYSKNQQQIQPFYPLYYQSHDSDNNVGFYTINRKDKLLSSNQKEQGVRSSYTGTETFVALSDPENPPYRKDLHHLQIQTLCTNRDLALLMTSGKTLKNLMPEFSGPVKSITCLVTPTTPQAPNNHGKRGWNLVQHVSINYLSLLEEDALTDTTRTSTNKALDTLKSLLQLYNITNNTARNKQINAISQLHSKSIHYRLPQKGPITYIRGHDVIVECDEDAFQGDSLFQFGHLLCEFFQRYTSMHSVTGLRLLSQQRGELKRWKPAIGDQKPY